MDTTRLVRFLVESRKARGISMRQLASRIGLGASQMGRVERGERELMLRHLGPICDELGVDVYFNLVRDPEGHEGGVFTLAGELDDDAMAILSEMAALLVVMDKPGRDAVRHLLNYWRTVYRKTA